MKFLKYFVPTRPDISAKRIIYPLPNPALFSKYYNKDEYFKDVDWSDWQTVIDGFKKRFDCWYFSNMVGSHSSYMDFCSLCALVEVFSHYQNTTDWHNPNQYKEFLRRLDSTFRKKLAKPIVVTRFEGQWNEGKLKDIADVFYSGVRCALHHHGDLAPYAGMSGTGKIAVEIKNAGTSICGRHSYSIVVFDPSKIKESLANWLKQYCDELKSASTSKQSLNFKKTFKNDFGILIP